MPDRRIMANIRALCIYAVLICTLSPAPGRGADFLEAKTVFQTNTAYDSRLDIAVDGVVVHRHGGKFAQAMQSWRDNGFTVGRMFFADSDAANAYWTGKWDGTEHRQDVERDRRAYEISNCRCQRKYQKSTRTDYPGCQQQPKCLDFR